MFESQRTFDGSGESADVSIAELFRSCPNVWSPEQSRRYVFVNMPKASNFLENIVSGPMLNGGFTGEPWTRETLDPLWQKFCATIPSLETFARTPRANGTAKGRASPTMRACHLWYDRYLQSKHWKRVVSAAHAHYDNCVCGSYSNLETHHKCQFSYEQCGSERVPQDISLLCEDCHMLFHAHNHLCVPSKPPKGAIAVLDGEHIHWH